MMLVAGQTLAPGLPFFFEMLIFSRLKIRFLSVHRSISIRQSSSFLQPPAKISLSLSLLNKAGARFPSSPILRRRPRHRVRSCSPRSLSPTLAQPQPPSPATRRGGATASAVTPATTAGSSCRPRSPLLSPTAINPPLTTWQHHCRRLSQGKMFFFSNFAWACC
jgi:hypothetical protein